MHSTPPLVASPSLPLTAEVLADREGEPRVQDLQLGFSLGMKNPSSAMRQLIVRNRAELSGYGEVSATVAETSIKGGRPGKEYWLNEGQALVLCALSRTPQAAAVRKQIITVFMAYRAGKLNPAAESGADRIAALAASLEAIRVELVALQEAAAPRSEPAGPQRLESSGMDRSNLLHGVKAIAAHLGVRPRQVYHHAATGRIPTFKLGKTVCSTRSSLDASIARRLPIVEVRA